MSAPKNAVYLLSVAKVDIKSPIAKRTTAKAPKVKFLPREIIVLITTAPNTHAARTATTNIFGRLTGSESPVHTNIVVKAPVTRISLWIPVIFSAVAATALAWLENFIDLILSQGRSGSRVLEATSRNHCTNQF